METSLIEFRNFPTCFTDKDRGKSHESVLRSFHIVSHVLKMVQRGDSKETILEVVTLLKNLPEPKDL